MEWTVALSILVGTLAFCLMLGLPVAISFFGVNIVGAFIFLGGEVGLVQMTRNVVTAITNYNLAPIPLFIYCTRVWPLKPSMPLNDSLPKYRGACRW